MRTWARSKNGMMSYGYMNSVTEGRLCPPDQCSELQSPEPAGASVPKSRDWMLCPSQVFCEPSAQPGLKPGRVYCVLCVYWKTKNGQGGAWTLSHIHSYSVLSITDTAQLAFFQAMDQQGPACVTMVCRWLTHSQHWSGLERTQLWGILESVLYHPDH